MNYKNRMEMKKKRLSVAGLALLALLLAACSNDDNTNTQTVEIGTKAAAITLNMEGFGTDQNVTRAAQTAKTETVDLGDGLTAEVSLTADAKEEQGAATRATMTDGHYTIYVLDASGNRIAGKELKGTVSGNTFVKDAGSRLYLTPGTYTFVCYNDAAVTDNGTNLTVRNGKNSLIGTTTATISGDGYQISFQMKHQTARLRFKFTAYTDQLTGGTATVTSTTAQPVTNTYSPDATGITTTTGTASNPYTTTLSGKHATYVQANVFTTDYNYFLPGMPAADLKLTFDAGSTAYGASIAGKSITLPSSLATLARNGSYTVNIRLSTVLFLFNDGTVGAAPEKGSRTPIGFVTKEKTATEEGTAMALQPMLDASYSSTVCFDKANEPASTSFENIAQYDYPNSLNDLDGYNYTWNSQYSADHTTVKAQNPQNSAFYAAAHYSPGVATSNIGNWYLPAMGELSVMLKRLRIADITTGNPFTPGNTTYIQPYADMVGGYCSGRFYSFEHGNDR